MSVDPAALLNASVSKNEIDRCALLYDTLIKEGEALGYSWSVQPKGTQVTVVGETLMFFVQERLIRTELPRPEPRVLKPRKPWTPDFSAIRAPRYSWSATGELSFHVVARTEYLQRKNWKYTKIGRLEQKLGQILEAFLKIAASVKACRNEWEARQRGWARESREREERIELTKRTEKLRSDLMANTVDWERAQRLRGFINAAIEAAPPDEQSQQELALWVAWAQWQVDQLDPLRRGISAVIRMSLPRETNAYSGPSYGSQKEEKRWWR